MDRAEGALLVAERALSEARSAADKIAALPPRARTASSFFVDAAGELLIVYDDGTAISAGRVQGNDGAPGASIVEGNIDPDGCLILRLSDGRAVNVGVVRGPAGKDGAPGQPGRSIVRGELDEWGHLLLTYTDGAADNVGLVALAGPQGLQGIGIEGLAINDAGELVIALSNDSSQNLGIVRGARGPAGAQGIKGDQGPAGPAGPPGQSIQGERGPAGPRGEPGSPGQDGLSGSRVEFGESRPSNLSAADLGRLRWHEVFVDGQSIGEFLGR